MRGLEGDDVVGLFPRAGDAQEVQHLLDVLAVLGTKGDQARVVAQIIIAVGQPQARFA